MEKEERLAFCKKCTHRRMDLNQEFVCGLTGSIASFEGNCNDFEADELYIKSTKRVVKKQKKSKKQARILIIILFVFFVFRIIRLIMMAEH